MSLSPQDKNTHYAVVSFSGDPAEEHPDDKLCGQAPHLELIACGSEEFCWQAAIEWTAKHPLQMWQEVEILSRDKMSSRTELRRLRRIV